MVVLLCQQLLWAKWNWILFLFLLLSICIPAGIAQNISEGQAIFTSKCVACHTIGKGKLVGPDLLGVAEKRDRKWLEDFIYQPDKMIAAEDSLAMALLKAYNKIPMVNQGLTPSQVQSVIAFLEAQKVEAKPVLAQADSDSVLLTPPASGDPAFGRMLFTGQRSFKNGGAACVSCHSLAGISSFGGGSLGPELTLAYTKFGDAGLASVLKNVSFPTMTPLYQNKQLTDEEVEQLKAFLYSVRERKPRLTALLNFQIVLVSLGGFLLFLIIAQLFWRKRLRGVNQLLREQYR